MYIVPLVPAAGEKKIYIKALEHRIAELEAYLASIGHPRVGTDHLTRLGQSTSSSQNVAALPVVGLPQQQAPMPEQNQRNDEDEQQHQQQVDRCHNFEDH